MKDPHHRDREFNTPAEMFNRASLFAAQAAFAIGSLLTIAGVLARELQWSIAGVGVIALAWSGRAWLQRRGGFDSADRAVDNLSRAGPAPDEERAEELMLLLERWEALEQKRGSPEFDPWTLQVLRNDIRRAVESDPALERLFTNLRRAA